MPRRWAVLLVPPAAALLVGTAAALTASPRREPLLRTRAPITGLAADGTRAVVSTKCRPHGFWVRVWNPVLGSTTSVGARTGAEACVGNEGIAQQGIGGRRLAWVRYAAGNETEEWLLTASTASARRITRLGGVKVRNSGDGVGDFVGNLHGDGSLLVYNTGSVSAGRHVYNESLWQIVGRSSRRLLTSPDEVKVLSVAAGRILLKREDGSLELRRADGSLLRAFPFERGEMRAAVLDASELVVLHYRDRLTWRVYDPVSGDQKRTLPATGHPRVADVERGLLVYVKGRIVHVLRLADGRERTFIAPVVGSRDPDAYYTFPVEAQIEPSGLFFSYQVRDEGRVRFVPFNEIRFGR